jgi:hypothetical protein
MAGGNVKGLNPFRIKTLMILLARDCVETAGVHAQAGRPVQVHGGKIGKISDSRSDQAYRQEDYCTEPFFDGTDQEKRQ